MDQQGKVCMFILYYKKLDTERAIVLNNSRIARNPGVTNHAWQCTMDKSGKIASILLLEWWVLRTAGHFDEQPVRGLRCSLVRNMPEMCDKWHSRSTASYARSSMIPCRGMNIEYIT